MRHTCSALFALLGGAVLLTAQAADPKLQKLPEPPPMTPAPAAHGAPAARPAPAPETPPADNPEPEITITTRGEDRHEEYRLRGQLYMIKVTPPHGRPYYLIDNEGAGNFSRSDFAPGIAVPLWVIKRF